jgi:hypothetical protein
LVDAIPSGGWRFATSINGVPLEIHGISPVDVMSKTREYFFRNSTPFDETRFWIEANIQWVGSSDVRHHLVGVADLVATASGSLSGAQSQAAVAHSPSEWGSVAWRFLGLVLAKDRFNAQEFISVMRLVTDMLNPSTNPRLGCSECYTKAVTMLNELVHNPPNSIQAARDWLVANHNHVNERLGKPKLGTSDAAQANFWSA